jgi:hypothetical protein
MISLVETNISSLYPSSMILDGEYAEVEKRSFCYNEEVSSSMKSWWIQNRKGGAAIPLCHIHIMVLVEVSLPDFDEIFNLECEWDPRHPKKRIRGNHFNFGSRFRMSSRNKSAA